MAVMLKRSPAYMWTQKVCLDLARLYEKYDLLWNPMHPEYYSTLLKEDAWTEIAHLMSAEVDECKKKIDSMKGSYRREKSRARKYAREGMPFASKWFGYKTLSFLDAKTRKGSHSSSKSPTKELEGPPELIWDLGGAADGGGPETTPPGGGPFGGPLAEGHKDVKPRLARGGRSSGAKRPFDEDARDLYLKELVETADAGQAQGLLPPPPPQVPKDECAAFAAYVEAKLRKFDEHHQNIAQHRINNMLFDIEMSLYATDSNISQLHQADSIAPSMEG